VGEVAVRALDGVSLEVCRRERVALLGRSGSGKTTLLHVLGGLVRPTAGTVEWHGALRSDDRAAPAAAGIALVFQGANLLPHFTAFENVAFAAEVAGRDVDSTLAPGPLLELVGLGSKLDHLPDELSGGEAQRVAIARALATRPELLLCDEPTGHLDSDTGERVLDLIDALQEELGFVLVVATHDPDVAARYRRELELEDGVVVHEDEGSL
jgi:putative ABC transport system ATP-binding protein